MGTRNLTIVKSDGKLFGQYGQWDGYPEGAGVDVYHFIAGVMNEKKFKENFARSQFVTAKEVEARYRELGADATGFVNMDIAHKFKEKYPQLDRDMGSDVLQYIQQTRNPELFDSINFAADSLFCEWAWMLDFDTKSLKVFEGFNKEPLADDQFFKYLESKAEEDYYPVKQILELTFEEVKGMKDEKVFLENFKNPEDEDSEEE